MIGMNVLGSYSMEVHIGRIFKIIFCDLVDAGLKNYMVCIFLRYWHKSEDVDHMRLCKILFLSSLLQTRNKKQRML